MKIYYSKYQLDKKSTLNAKDISGSQEGALIKTVDDEHQWGVSDLCPWPNLGDLTLDEELQSKGPLLQRSLELAAEDLKARKSRKSLLSEKWVENNWLITDFQNPETAIPKTGVVKIKGTNQIEHLISFLMKVVSLSECKIRLDFNSSLAASEFNYFLNNLPNTVGSRIEYIEDPTMWNFENWKTWNQKIPLALDFVAIDAFKHTAAWAYLIIKPSRQSTKNLIAKCRDHQKKFTITSAMDHPVGVAHGLRYAQNYAQNASGFLTLDLYEKTIFHSYFKSDGQQIGFAEKTLDDTGIGMTTVLNSLTWTEL